MASWPPRLQETWKSRFRATADKSKCGFTTSPSSAAWDSRFGDNYWFDVAGLEPVQLQDPVRYRDGAIARPEFVNVYDQTAVKKDVFPAPPSGSPVGKDLRTSLSVRAWVKNIAFVKEVWIDLHVFDRSATLIKAATLGLRW